MNFSDSGEEAMRKKCVDVFLGGVEETMHTCMEQLLNNVMKNPSLAHSPRMKYLRDFVHYADRHPGVFDKAEEAANETIPSNKDACDKTSTTAEDTCSSISTTSSATTKESYNKAEEGNRLTLHHPKLDMTPDEIDKLILECYPECSQPETPEPDQKQDTSKARCDKMPSQSTNSTLTNKEKDGPRFETDDQVDEYYRSETLKCRQRKAKETMIENDISREKYANEPNERKQCPVCFKNRATFQFQDRKHLRTNKPKKGAKLWHYCPLADPPSVFAFIMSKKDKQRIEKNRKRNRERKQRMDLKKLDK